MSLFSVCQRDCDRDRLNLDIFCLEGETSTLSNHNEQRFFQLGKTETIGQETGGEEEGQSRREHHH